MSVEIAKYSFTAEEFERLGAAGILSEDARLAHALELLGGERVPGDLC